MPTGTSTTAEQTLEHEVDAPDFDLTSEEGSLVTEYGLLAVGGAAVCGALIKFAGTNAINAFFQALLDVARRLVS
jgi:hypothetical protein